MSMNICNINLYTLLFICHSDIFLQKIIDHNYINNDNPEI